MKKILWLHSKMAIVVAAIVACLSLSLVSSTVAYLVHTSNSDSTTMQKATHGLSIEGSTPTAMTVKNTGNIPMYVRVVFAVNYVNASSKNWHNPETNSMENTRQYLADAPHDASYYADDGQHKAGEYSFTPGTDWVRKDITEKVGSTNVTYKVLYYTKPLANDTSTTPIFKSFTGSVKKKGYSAQGTSRDYQMTIDLLVDGIQCEKAANFDGGVNSTAVYKAWGIKPSAVGGDLTAANAPSTDAVVAP